MMEEKIFNIKNDKEFTDLALKVFKYQAQNNIVYKEFVGFRNINIENVISLSEIPFLPIDFFKSRKIVAGSDSTVKVFKSSGTTGSIASRHFLTDLGIYEESFTRCFEIFYGPVADYRILALLPGYIENPGSSLVYMMQKLIDKSNHPESGFYLDNHDELAEKLSDSQSKTLLLGVSFALLDFIEKHDLRLKNIIVMETGGMKGKRTELTREELHKRLCLGLGVSDIHSEYGMTEMLSQAYSLGDRRFKAPPWMKVFIRDAYDPLSSAPSSRTGGINVIDLANINSCSFIETYDLGRVHEDSSFEVLGRFDNSNIRGCNLLVD